MALLLGSIRMGVLSLIPNLIPIVLTLSIMGLLDIPLNVGTAMIAVIAVAIAIDDTIHYMLRNKWELGTHRDPTVALHHTLRNEGQPIVTTSLGLTAGFVSLALSNFVPTIQFGLLAGPVLMLAVLADLIITPVLMVHGGPRRPDASRSPELVDSGGPSRFDVLRA